MVKEGDAAVVPGVISRSADKLFVVMRATGVTECRMPAALPNLSTSAKARNLSLIIRLARTQKLPRTLIQSGVKCMCQSYGGNSGYMREVGS